MVPRCATVLFPLLCLVCCLQNWLVAISHQSPVIFTTFMELCWNYNSSNFRILTCWQMIHQKKLIFFSPVFWKFLPVSKCSSNNLNYFQPQSFPSPSVPPSPTPASSVRRKSQPRTVCSVIPVQRISGTNPDENRPETHQKHKRQLSKRDFTGKDDSEHQAARRKKNFAGMNAKMKNEAIKKTSGIVFSSVTPVWTKFGSCRWNLKSAPGLKRMYMSLSWQA